MNDIANPETKQNDAAETDELNPKHSSIEDDLLRFTPEERKELTKHSVEMLAWRNMTDEEENQNQEEEEIIKVDDKDSEDTNLQHYKPSATNIITSKTNGNHTDTTVTNNLIDIHDFRDEQQNNEANEMTGKTRDIINVYLLVCVNILLEVQ